MMAGEELLEERLIILPMRLETIAVSAGEITQTAGLSQSAWSNQNGGLCIKSTCTQVSVQVNDSDVDQKAVASITVTDVIDDNRWIVQAFTFT